MRQKKILSAVLAGTVMSFILLNPVSAEESIRYKDVSFSGVAVNNGVPVKGVDISSVISLEDSGVVFRDASGNPQDIFLTLKESGVNYIRVRVWNDPKSSSGATYGGGANDIDTAVRIAQRCKKYGLKMLVDFHYSDFWADPGKQIAPKAWKNYSVGQKEEAIKTFTYDSLKKISETGVKIGMVQIGNETTSGLCGETSWNNICRLMNAGSRAVRSFDRNILVAVHFTNPEKSGFMDTLAGYLKTYNVDYDVFATSYYPYWHGTPENLTSVLKSVSEKYRKYVMVAETSWANTYEDTDHFGNTISSADQLGNYVSYPVSVQGQADLVSDVFKAVADTGSKGIGAFYWEPAWITLANDYYGNLELWEKHGSGWASQAAQEYQDDARYFGGSAVDNQAMFTWDGRPLDSLSVFKHIYSDQKDERENLILNYSFENDHGNTEKPEGWIINDTTKGEYSKFTVNSEMVRTGDYSAHWYSAEPFDNSGITTEFQASETGKYEFSSYIAGEGSRYSVVVSVNGKKSVFSEGQTFSYDRWEKAGAEFYASSGDKISVCIDISGASESYGSIDDCSLYFTKSEIPQDPQQPGEPPHEEKHRRGDINRDGSVSASDLIKFIKYFMAAEKFQDEEYETADINEDGVINIIDCILLKELLF